MISHPLCPDQLMLCSIGDIFGGWDPPLPEQLRHAEHAPPDWFRSPNSTSHLFVVHLEPRCPSGQPDQVDERVANPWETECIHKQVQARERRRNLICPPRSEPQSPVAGPTKVLQEVLLVFTPPKLSQSTQKP